MASGVRRALIVLAVIAPVWFTARAANLEGVDVPDTQQVDGKTLQLNGYGMRNYALIVHVYVAALYLEHPGTDAAAILASPETKLLSVTFLRNIDADSARKAWRDGLDNNCRSPCILNPDDLADFLAQVPAMRAGDNFSLVFTASGATVSVNGDHIGMVSHRPFAEAMLATFLGPRPASPTLRQDLLAGGAKP